MEDININNKGRNRSEDANNMDLDLVVVNCESMDWIGEYHRKERVKRKKMVILISVTNSTRILIVVATSLSPVDGMEHQQLHI